MPLTQASFRAQREIHSCAFFSPVHPLRYEILPETQRIEPARNCQELIKIHLGQAHSTHVCGVHNDDLLEGRGFADRRYRTGRTST